MASRWHRQGTKLVGVWAYIFKTPALLHEALRMPSKQGGGGRDLRRLALVGGQLVVTFFATRTSDATERGKELHALLEKFGSDGVLGMIAERMDIEPYVIRHRQDLLNRRRLAEVFRAMVGAIFEDSGFDHVLIIQILEEVILSDSEMRAKSKLELLMSPEQVRMLERACAQVAHPRQDDLEEAMAKDRPTPIPDVLPAPDPTDPVAQVTEIVRRLTGVVPRFERCRSRDDRKDHVIVEVVFQNGDLRSLGKGQGRDLPSASRDAAFRLLQYGGQKLRRVLGMPPLT